MIEVYREWVPRIDGDVSILDQLPSSWARSQVQMVIHAAIHAEAPIQRDRLAKVVAGAFGLGRVSADRRRAIQDVVPREYLRASDPDFYWPRCIEPETWRVVRRPVEGRSRRLEEVSLVEIANAMFVAAELAGGIEIDELKRDALELFRGSRMTPGVSARLDEGAKWALANGVLRQTDSGLFKP
jgi:hypothetical protein